MKHSEVEINRENYTYLVFYENRKTDGVCQNKQEKHKEESHEGLENLNNHDHVDTESRQTTEEQQQIYPRHKDVESGQLPLPVLHRYRRKHRYSITRMLKAGSCYCQSCIDIG